MLSPLDNQIAINHSVATEKIQEVQQRHPDLQQRQFALQLHEEQESKNRDVRNTERTDQAQIRAREKGEGRARGRKKHRVVRAADESSKSDESKRGDPARQVDVFV